MDDVVAGHPVGDVVRDWAPRPWPTASRLEGCHVTLEPLTPDHAAALFASLAADDADEPLWVYRPTPRPADVAAMTALISTQLAIPAIENWAVVPSGGAPAGMTTFMRIEPAHGQVEIAGVLYSRAMQGTAASTEVSHLLLAHAFDDLGYRRVEWKCDSRNEPSHRAAARLGFTYEGRFRHHMVIKGRNRDTDWFSITDAEWPAVRAAHRAWLQPANFDDLGRQRAPLAVRR